MIEDNIKKITSIINNFFRENPGCSRDIVLVGVTKYSNADQVRTGIQAGLTHIAENYVKDAQSKFFELGPDLNGVTRHLIGHLQSNKARLAVELFDLIQSVDSLKLAREIDKQAAKINKQMAILLEVNPGEDQKTGFPAADVTAALEQISDLEHVRVQGLMGMAPFVKDEDVIRTCFRALSVLRDELALKYADHPRVEMKYLSMGMSADYRIALKEGANMLRIGSAIFRGE